MKVWLVYYGSSTRFSRVVKIFTSQTKAENYINKSKFPAYCFIREGVVE